MLFQPTNVLPSDQSGAGAGTVDASEMVEVSWQVNGPSGMVAYQIDIMQNDTASTEIFTTGRTVLQEPFYGVDYNGNVQYFSTKLPTSTGMINGYANGYKMVITQWWSQTESITQTSASFFITRAAPTLELNDLPATIDARTAEFSATYSQAQGDTLDWFRWQIAEATNLDEPIKDTGQIYGTADIRVSYDGFFPGTEYMIRCQIQTENGVLADTGWQQFYCQYDTAPQRGIVTACRAGEHRSAVYLNWSGATYILGTPEGSWSIENDELILGEGASVTWDNVSGQIMDFAAPWTFAWRGRPASIPITPWEMTGTLGETMSMSITSDTISITLNGEVVFTYSPTEAGFIPGQWMAVVLTPTMVYIRNSYEMNGLYPLETLYPSDTLYPDPGENYTNNYSLPITYEQFNVNSVTLNGAQTCAYVWLTQGTPSQEIINSVLNDGEFMPEFDDSTYMLANFANNLNAGSLTIAASDVSGFAVYRREGESSFLAHIADVSLATTAIYDYSAKSQSTYTYYIFALSPTVYVTEPLVSAQVTPVFWDWAILECTEDTNGVYHVTTEHKFSLNVTTGTMSNNSTPVLLTNFTRYPKRQPVAANYKTGTLQGYIGSVDYVNNKYTDTSAQADARFDLSTSDSIKFLKNRKGDIWRIETESPITMQVGDNLPQQPYVGSIPWVEVGSAENAPVIQEA